MLRNSDEYTHESLKIKHSKYLKFPGHANNVKITNTAPAVVSATTYGHLITFLVKVYSCLIHATYTHT